MLKPELKEQKHKRILLMYEELTRHKIDYTECLKFMSYVFGVSESYLTVILKSHDMADFSAVRLEHADLDNILVDAFAKKLYVQARKQRNDGQMSLFNPNL